MLFKNQNNTQKINFYCNSNNNINDYEIVFMQKNDLNFVVEIENLVDNPSWKATHFRDSLADTKNSFCWVLKSKYNQNLIIGFVILMIVLDEAHILNIAIQPNFRGKGLATKLLNFILKFAQQQNAKTMFLEVRFFNEIAQKLYQKFGFQQIGLRKKYYSANISEKTPDGKEDAIVMSKKIL